jgi:hypothetical protein
MFYITRTAGAQEGGDLYHLDERRKANRDGCEKEFRLRAENGVVLAHGLSDFHNDPSPLFDYGIKVGAHSIEFIDPETKRWAVAACCGARPVA